MNIPFNSANIIDIYLAMASSISETEGSLAEFIPTPISQNPFFWVGLGASITLVSALVFANLMNTKLMRWENKKISPLPLGNPMTITSWIGSLIGITIFFTGALKAIDFSPVKSLIAAFIIITISGVLMWRVVNDLLKQINCGEIKEIDEYF